MVFARSRRSLDVLAAASLLVAIVLALFAAQRGVAGDAWTALLLCMLAGVAFAVLGRAVRGLRRWPVARLGLFRDRLAIVHGRSELQAPWTLVAGVTLAAQSEWGSLSWPEVRLTDRLTVRLLSGRAFSFRPGAFGLHPGACRDLLLRLRDEPGLRATLPEFDSQLDLARRPFRTGLLARPQL